VVSILLAFGIDAWWGALQARREALATLDRVVEEVAQARAEIERGHQFQLRFQANAELLRTALLSTQPGEWLEVPDTLLFGVLASQVAEVQTPNAASFVASEAFELSCASSARVSSHPIVRPGEHGLDRSERHPRVRDGRCRRLDRAAGRARGMTRNCCRPRRRRGKLASLADSY
jgi:hypothetical protein